MVDPVTGWSLVKTVADATKKLYDVAKGVKDYETKQKLSEVLDTLMELKQSASELEDQNRELREKLRFKGDQYEFRNPFWYGKDKPQQPLCPVCFAKNQAAPMAEEYDGYRQCLVCKSGVRLRSPLPEEEVSYYSDDRNTF